MVDRKSRFLCAGLLNSGSSLETKGVIIKLLGDKPVKSISLDNGSKAMNPAGKVYTDPDDA